MVVETAPESGSTDADPKLTDIEVTFSKEMMAETWSWSTVSEDTIPEIDPWADGQEFSVHRKPGQKDVWMQMPSKNIAFGSGCPVRGYSLSSEG